MRKLTAIIAALGLLGSTSLIPVAAAPAGDTVVKSDDFSAAKKKKKKMKKAKKAKKSKKKMSEIVANDDFSAMAHEKKAKKKAKKKKKADAVILYRIAA
jgi:hypothetical protein